MNHFLRSVLFSEKSVDKITFFLYVTACNLVDLCQCSEQLQDRILSAVAEGCRGLLQNVDRPTYEPKKHATVILTRTAW
jgi:hypothetical protein